MAIIEFVDRNKDAKNPSVKQENKTVENKKRGS